MLAQHQAKGEKTFSGADSFKLYDTYGFPMDLTLEMVEEQGMTLDEKAFHALMEEQRQRARKAREALGDLGWAGVEFGKDVPETEFVGYENNSIAGAKVVALVVENEQAEELMPGVEGIVVLDKTPFYAEMGGQVADHGTIAKSGGNGCLFQVTDVQKNKGGKYMHYGKVTEGTLKLGDAVSAQIDVPRRNAVRRAHTATHLLHKALQTVLGSHVHQAGSLVEPDYLRFDFTHFSAMTAQELGEVSRIVNESILEGYPVNTKVMGIEEAKQTGATALFGEKYGDTVRVVDMDGYSVEFCGGTHLDNTAKVGVFHIQSEFSVASGVRRIEATTGLKSLEVMNHNQDLLFQAAAALKNTLYAASELPAVADLSLQSQASSYEYAFMANAFADIFAETADGEFLKAAKFALDEWGENFMTPHGVWSVNSRNSQFGAYARSVISEDLRLPSYIGEGLQAINKLRRLDSSFDASAYAGPRRYEDLPETAKGPGDAPVHSSIRLSAFE